MEKAIKSRVDMDTIVSLCKRRGFVFQSSEIYGGLGSCWDYGPLGVELKNNVKRAWWKAMVQERDDMVGLDASILMHSQTWVSSGHVGGFADPMVDCRACKQRFRPDDIVGGGKGGDLAIRAGDGGPGGRGGDVSIRAGDAGAGDRGGDVTFRAGDAVGATICPNCGAQNSFTQPRMFNLMFKTFMGPVEDEAAQVYLRPETAQGIFVNFANVLNTTRKKLPFGIAQIGKAFRNEITPGNFTFRSREFEQMEIEYFVAPGADEEWLRRWLDIRFQWYLTLGIKEESLRLRQHMHTELAHYAKDCYDVEYLFPMGWSELEGIANRSDFDLRQHSQFSGKELTYYDEETGQHILPYVIEPSGGVDRATLAFLIDAYDEEPDKEETRVVLRFNPALAPIKVAVLPLSKKEPLTALAKEIYAQVRKHWMAQYDEVQSIGRRYRRQDEIGTPLCVTIDFQSLEDRQVTIRDRDNMSQVRVPIAELKQHLARMLGHI